MSLDVLTSFLPPVPSTICALVITAVFPFLSWLVLLFACWCSRAFPTLVSIFSYGKLSSGEASTAAASEAQSEAPPPKSKGQSFLHRVVFNPLFYTSHGAGFSLYYHIATLFFLIIFFEILMVAVVPLHDPLVTVESVYRANNTVQLFPTNSTSEILSLGPPPISASFAKVLPFRWIVHPFLSLLSFLHRYHLMIHPYLLSFAQTTNHHHSPLPLTTAHTPQHQQHIDPVYWQHLAQAFVITQSNISRSFHTIIDRRIWYPASLIHSLPHQFQLLIQFIVDAAKQCFEPIFFLSSALPLPLQLHENSSSYIAAQIINIQESIYPSSSSSFSLPNSTLNSTWYTTNTTLSPILPLDTITAVSVWFSIQPDQLQTTIHHPPHHHPAPLAIPQLLSTWIESTTFLSLGRYQLCVGILLCCMMCQIIRRLYETYFTHVSAKHSAKQHLAVTVAGICFYLLVIATPIFISFVGILAWDSVATANAMRYFKEIAPIRLALQSKLSSRLFYLTSFESSRLHSFSSFPTSSLIDFCLYSTQLIITSIFFIVPIVQSVLFWIYTVMYIISEVLLTIALPQLLSTTEQLIEQQTIISSATAMSSSSFIPIWNTTLVNSNFFPTFAPQSIISFSNEMITQEVQTVQQYVSSIDTLLLTTDTIDEIAQAVFINQKQLFLQLPRHIFRSFSSIFSLHTIQYTIISSFEALSHFFVSLSPIGIFCLFVVLHIAMCLILFMFFSAMQHRCHVILSNLRLLPRQNPPQRAVVAAAAAAAVVANSSSSSSPASEVPISHRHTTAHAASPPPPSKSYFIPYSGWFAFLTCPHYFCEICIYFIFFAMIPNHPTNFAPLPQLFSTIVLYSLINSPIYSYLVTIITTSVIHQQQQQQLNLLITIISAWVFFLFSPLWLCAIWVASNLLITASSTKQWYIATFGPKFISLGRNALCPDPITFLWMLLNPFTW